MFDKILLVWLLILSHCQPALAVGSMKFSRIDVQTKNGTSTTNYVKNPSGFKNALDVTTSSASIAQDVTGSSDLIDGVASLVCDASAQNGYCEWDSETIQEGDKTGNCEAKAIFKGDASLYKLQVADGSGVLTSSSVLTNATDWTEVSVNYPCGSTRKVRLTQTESGTGAAVNIGRVYWGRATNLGVANQIGSCQTVTMMSSWVANTTTTAIECRVGDRAFYEAQVATSGAPTSAALTFTLPTGRVIDTTKILSVGVEQPLGYGKINDSNAAVYHVAVRYSSTSTVAVINLGVAGTYVNEPSGVDQATPITFGASDFVNVKFSVPIVGWGAQAVASNSQQLLPTQQRFTSGSGTYTTPAGVVSLRVRMVGGGGGGSGSMTSAGSTGTAPTAGGNTTFGTSLLTSNGGALAGRGSQAQGGVGGTATIAAPAFGTALQGSQGGSTGESNVASVNFGGVGNGGGTMFGGGGPGGPSAAAGIAPIANTGAGGGGGGAPATGITGAGGGGGGYVDAIINNPSSSYAYSVGAAGNAGGAGTSGFAGAAGAAGYIEVTEYYSNAAPLLVGSVTSNSSGLERSERAYITYSAGVPSVTSQSGSWITSVTDNGTGDATLVIPSGIFSSAPSCNATAQASGATNYIAKITSATTTTAASIYLTDHANTAADVNFYIHCTGPR